jgi:hypothetical protein
MFRSRDAILVVVDEDEFANFFAEGRTMKVAQAICLALKELQ